MSKVVLINNPAAFYAQLDGVKELDLLTLDVESWIQPPSLSHIRKHELVAVFLHGIVS